MIDRDSLPMQKQGFNRYMVECEYIARLCFFKSICVLIDTWWNVNSCSSYGG